ncbi:MAG: hypothetical protein IJD57_03825 [Candidatus Gastranaerophilales bacterium]|nr:hypothetical protein [Candidatus Gastranaerophilales bacterium]
MKKEKITFLKEKKVSKLAKTNFENTYAQNPIQAKFLAFKETKKSIDVKDLF